MFSPYSKDATAPEFSECIHWNCLKDSITYFKTKARENTHLCHLLNRRSKSGTGGCASLPALSTYFIWFPQLLELVRAGLSSPSQQMKKWRPVVIKYWPRITRLMTPAF
jgi:hypothetical protein